MVWDSRTIRGLCPGAYAAFPMAFSTFSIRFLKSCQLSGDRLMPFFVGIHLRGSPCFGKKWTRMSILGSPLYQPDWQPAFPWCFSEFRRFVSLVFMRLFVFFEFTSGGNIIEHFRFLPPLPQNSKLRLFTCEAGFQMSDSCQPLYSGSNAFETWEKSKINSRLSQANMTPPAGSGPATIGTGCVRLRNLDDPCWGMVRAG